MDTFSNLSNLQTVLWDSCLVFFLLFLFYTVCFASCLLFADTILYNVLPLILKLRSDVSIPCRLYLYTWTVYCTGSTNESGITKKVLISGLHFSSIILQNVLSIAYDTAFETIICWMIHVCSLFLEDLVQTWVRDTILVSVISSLQAGQEHLYLEWTVKTCQEDDELWLASTCARKVS